MEEVDEFDESLRIFTKEVCSLDERIDRTQVEKFVQKLHEIDRKGGYTYVYGLGRSGLVAEAILERLSNLGYNAFMIGRTGTPEVRKGDAVIYVSGSGDTTLVIVMARKTKKLKAVNFGVTSGKGKLDKYCHYLLHVPGRTRRKEERDYLQDQVVGFHAPLTALGTLFEVNALIVLDSLIPKLAKLKGIDEAKMRKRHFDY